MLSEPIREPGVALLADGNVEAVYLADGFVTDRLGAAEWSPLGERIDIPRDKFNIVAFVPFSRIFRDPAEWKPLTRETPDGCYDAYRKDNAIIGILVKAGGYTLVIVTDYWTDRGLDGLPDGILVRPHRVELAVLPKAKDEVSPNVILTEPANVDTARKIIEETMAKPHFATGMTTGEPQPEERPRVIDKPGQYQDENGNKRNLVHRIGVFDGFRWLSKDGRPTCWWNDFGDAQFPDDGFRIVGPWVDPEPRRKVVTGPGDYYDVEGRVWRVGRYEDGTDGYHWRNPYGDQRWNDYGERWPKAQQPGTHLVGRVGEKPRAITGLSRDEVDQIVATGIAKIEQRLAALESPATNLNLDVSHEVSRALHRIVRAMHDGHCPRCGYLGPSKEFEKHYERAPGNLAIIDHICPKCLFTVSHEAADAALVLFRPVLNKSLAIFERWDAKRLLGDIESPAKPTPQVRVGTAICRECGECDCVQFANDAVVIQTSLIGQPNSVVSYVNEAKAKRAGWTITWSDQ